MNRSMIRRRSAETIDRKGTVPRVEPGPIMDAGDSGSQP